MASPEQAVMNNEPKIFAKHKGEMCCQCCVNPLSDQKKYLCKLNCCSQNINVRGNPYRSTFNGCVCCGNACHCCCCEWRLCGYEFDCETDTFKCCSEYICTCSKNKCTVLCCECCDKNTCCCGCCKC